MPMLHDPSERAALAARLNQLTPTSRGLWGKMSVDQMLWHVNEGMEMGLGRRTVSELPVPMPRFLLRWIVLNLPWPKGKARTHPAFEAKATYDFEAERARTMALVEECARKPLDSSWPDSYAMGPMSGRDWSRMGVKHLDHHLRQFGV